MIRHCNPQSRWKALLCVAVINLRQLLVVSRLPHGNASFRNETKFEWRKIKKPAISIVKISSTSVLKNQQLTKQGNTTTIEAGYFQNDRNLRATTARRLGSIEIPDDAEDEDGDIPEPRMMEVSRGFIPLPCNGYMLGHVTATTCKTWTSMNFNVSEQVIIPCGQCVTMSEFTPEKSMVLNLPFGLNIEGKLDIPPGTHVSIITSHLFVQGLLTIRSEGPVQPIPPIRFIMTGDQDQLLVPHDTNLGLCGGKGFACNVGPRAVVVAGGKVDMIGMPNGCPSWVRPEFAIPWERGFRYKLSSADISPHWHQLGGACYDLASVTKTSGFWPYVKHLTLRRIVEYEYEFFRLSGRQEEWHSITWNIRPECVARDLTYTFKSQIRIHSPEPQKLVVVLKVFHWDGTPSEIHQILACPKPSSTDIGWVNCEGSVTFHEKFLNAEKVEVLFVSKDKTSDIDYREISFVYQGGAPKAVQTIAQAVDSCWTVGTTLAIPSQTLYYEDDSIVTLVQNSLTDGLTFEATDNLNGAVPKKLLTESDFPSSPREQAAEIMILNRNIVFESELEAEKAAAGHFMILNTPHTEQRVEGVSFVRFGQEGTTGRYPINLHMCGNLPGSRFVKNLIYKSNNRCIVLDGSSDVHIARNVAYDTVGHCYTLEDGGEMNNVFEYNIGARTLAAAKFDPGERDHEPATFMISNPRNTYRGNVAAGSSDSGFMLFFQKSVIGDSGNFQADVIPQYLDFKLFEDNIAHSNTVAGFKLAMVTPVERSTLKGIKAYRNRNFGIYTFTVENLIILEAYIADNQNGIDLNLSDDVLIQKSRIIGYSDSFRAYTDLTKEPKNNFCRPGALRQIGLDIPPILFNKMAGGTTLSEISIENFGAQHGCPTSLGIKICDDVGDAHSDVSISLSGVKFQNGARIGEVLSLCPAAQKGVSQIFIADDGGLNPSGSQPGYIISSDLVTGVQDLVQCGSAGEGTCASYCTGRCLRSVTILLSPHDSEGAVISIVDDTTSVELYKLHGTLDKSNIQDDHIWIKRRAYRTILPSGSFSASIKNPLTGLAFWPKAVDITYGNSPGCDGVSFSRLNMFRPPPAPGTCDQLIADGSFSDGAKTINSWYHNGGGIQLFQIGGTGNTISTVSRHSFLDGPMYYLDTRCFPEAGDVLEISADILLIGPLGHVDCNVFDYMSPVRCPTANLVGTKNHTLDYWWDVSYAQNLWKSNGLNRVAGTFILSEKAAAADSMALLFARVRKEFKIVVDNVSVKVYKQMCTNIVRNGDFKTKDHWYEMASEVTLNEGFLIISDRKHWYSGVAQRLSNLCLSVGQNYVVSAQIRLLAGETAITCDPGRLYVSDQSCPNINLRINTGTAERFMELGRTVGPYKEDPTEWNTIYGVFTVTEEMMRAKELLLYVNRAGQGVKMVIGNVKIMPAESDTFGLRDCNQLIRNPDASRGNAAFWLTTGVGSYVSTAPAAQSKIGQVFNHMGRTKWFHSMFQDIDKNCLIPNSKWMIEASVLIVDSTTNSIHACDPSCRTVGCAQGSGPGMCPWFQLTLENPGVKDTVSLFSESTETWQLTGFNKIYARYSPDPSVQDYESVYVSIIGPKAGINVIVDSITFSPEKLI